MGETREGRRRDEAGWALGAAMARENVEVLRKNIWGWVKGREREETREAGKDRPVGRKDGG